MLFSRRIGAVLLFVCLGAATPSHGDPRIGPTPPLSDPVEVSLLPSGISALPVTLNASKALLFKEDDGTDSLHFLGNFVLSIGEHADQRISSREAVVWVTHAGSGDRAYRKIHILLWRDARIQEIGGTVTTGPVLFATLNTTGEIRIEVDDVAYRPFVESQAYQRGREIRQALARDGEPSVTRGETVMLGVFDPGLRADGSEGIKKRPTVQMRSGGMLKTSEIEPGRRVLTITGGVHITRGTAGASEYLEIRADSIVAFLPRTDAYGTPRSVPATVSGLAPRRTSPADDTPAPAAGPRAMMAGLENIDIESAYLEGDVLLSLGANRVRASRLYYDFFHDRALILDAVVHTTLADRNIPLYLRASEIRQLSPREYTATDAILTTSEFYTPHYHVGARRIELANLTPTDPSGRLEGLITGRFRIDGATLNIGGRPIMLLPHIRGTIDTSETALQALQVGFSNRFGAELETEWSLFNVLGLETPDGFKGDLSFDYFSKRGPAIGADVKYERDTYFGLLRSYVLSDDGTDFLGRRRERPPSRDVRGRFLFRHRHYLSDDWELTLEASYISDHSFLEEFFESEFDKGKEQETLLYLKKQRDNTALTVLVKPRVLDFVTQTEHLPDISYYVIGKAVGDRATWYSENRAGVVRFRPAEEGVFDIPRDGVRDGSGSSARVDTRQELTWQADLGPIRVVPFVSGRASAWDDTRTTGGFGRTFGTIGVRASMYLSRVYPSVKSTLWDLDGVRHVVKFDLVAWVSGSNRDPEDLFPFDDTVEGIDETDGVSFGVRQRWQTKRGAGDNRRTVDFLTLDTEVGLFNGAERLERTHGFTSFSRPENSITQDYINNSLIYRINDRTALLSELNFDLNDGEVDILNVALAVERSPRLNYLFSYRLIEETESNLISFDMNYRLSEKHTLAIRERFDLDRGRTLDFTVAFIRKLPRWYGAISFALDEAEDDFGVSFSLWPEGLPQAKLGSRRFTGIPGIPGVPRDRYR